MSKRRDLLIEIGTEELPPKAMKGLSKAFTQGVVDGLKHADLGHGKSVSYAAPRRLAVLVHNVAAGQADKVVERRGPALAAAFDEEGCPTKAASGFARSCGVEVEQLEKLETEKGSWLVYRTEEAGRSAEQLIPDIVRQSLDKLPIPKRMRWGDLKVHFVRPVHWVVLLFGEDVIETEILSVHSGRETRGHRFHHPEPVYIGEPAAYAPLLETEGHVLASFEDRREAIRGQVMEAASSVDGTAVIDEDLLDEVTSMVEWPSAVVGQFEQRFLEVPSEALISAMKGHQKYFHVVDRKGGLMPYFITISNIESRDPEVVRKGNERVIRPRLADADFFWRLDRKQRLADRLESLKAVVFQNQLGTLFDKVGRVRELAAFIAERLGGNASQADRAAALAKCDLMTEMVGEFPELQGIMGRYYAVHDGEPGEVASAIDEHYMPRFAGDVVPSTVTGQAVAIADRLDTLIGIFGIGRTPSGDKDPFGLRRSGLGVLRIIIECNLNLDLQQLLTKAAVSYSGQKPALKFAATAEHRSALANQVFGFMMERLRGYYQEQGVTADVYEAVLARQPTQPRDFDARVKAVTEFRKLPEAESLAAANKRITNILKQAEGEVPEQVDDAHLVEEAERVLARQLVELEERLQPAFKVRDYGIAMRELARLREPVDAFFDGVMVMVDDEKLRKNRLALLQRLRHLFLQVADLSRLQEKSN
jgi:glycyl-tRNA synthetase beta chain